MNAVVTKGKKQGSYRGRVAIRASRSFTIKSHQWLIQGISYLYCTVVQRGDGYEYTKIAFNESDSGAIPPMPKGRGFSHNTR